MSRNEACASPSNDMYIHFFQWLYRLAVEEVPEGDYMLPLSQAEV